MIKEPEVLERLENATCLLFSVIAETVYTEASAYVHRFQDFGYFELENKQAIIDFLINKLVNVVQHSVGTKNRICGDDGRDWTYTFFRHWMAALLVSSYGVDGNSIPESFKIGKI